MRAGAPMALPNLSALVPPTGIHYTKGVVVDEDKRQSQDDDPRCAFKVCTDENSLAWDVLGKELLYAEEVMVRYERPLPNDFEKERIEHYRPGNDYHDENLEAQWEKVLYHRINDKGKFLSEELKTEYQHGIKFRSLLVGQQVRFVLGELAVFWRGDRPPRDNIGSTLWMETVPDTCNQNTKRRICLIPMSTWAGRLAAMTPDDRKTHRKETLFDGYCQLLKAAFDLDLRGPTAGPKGKPLWIEEATFAAVLLELYVPVLRDVVRAENPRKELTDIDAEKEVYKQAGCSSTYDTKSGATKQASDIHRLIVSLKQQAQTLSEELREYRQRKKAGTVRDDDDVPSREELLAEWMADWNKRRNGVDLS